MLTRKINVVIKRVGEPFKLASIANDLVQMQAIVEGPIEVVRLGEKICLVCNEEGKISMKPINFTMPKDFIAGNVFFAKAFQDVFISLSMDDVYQIAKWLYEWGQTDSLDIYDNMKKEFH